MQIFKFGGASLKDAQGIERVGTIIKQYQNEHLVIVVSAMGKTTNALEWVYRYYIENSIQKYEALQEIKTFHFNILNSLFKQTDNVFQEVQTWFNKLEQKINTTPSSNIDFEYDQIVSYGELISSKIVEHYLRSAGIVLTWWDIRRLLITDANYKEASVLFDKSTPKINQCFQTKGIHLCQGFIGGTEMGDSTTLGREGSDYTAAALAYMLNANAVTIWKDVPGVLNADPRIIPEAVKLDKITYKEAIELAYYGAQVIHPKTIKPLQNKNIPLWVKPFLAPQEAGTVVQNLNEKIALPPIFIYKYHQVLISIMPKDFSFIAENNISLIFSYLAKHKIKVNLMQQSAVSFSICVDYDERKLNAFLQAMKNQFDVLYNTDLTLITIRHYTDEAIKKVIGNNKIIIKEISRKTARLVVK
ncbi:MAG: aspartate kinase [Bacteroidales bacterium]|nr:aspartate kinase [Bacteroidales bacterium]